MTTSSGAPTAAADHPLARVKYVALTTFRKSGEGVATPVWIAPDGDHLVVITVDGVGKTKRLANNPDVTLQECDVRGRVTPGTPVYAATARVVRDPAQVSGVRAAIAKKYGLAARAFSLVEAAAKVIGRTTKSRAGIILTPLT